MIHTTINDAVESEIYVIVKLAMLIRKTHDDIT